VWLGLSQLHTLRDVDLDKVSFAAIAAALPRRHTLSAVRRSTIHDTAAVAGFFTDLLPRLRVFHFFGMWPREAATAAVAPLPQLAELYWYEYDSTERMSIPLPPAFLGARPIVLHAPYNLITEFLPGRGGTLDDPVSRFLARVRELHLDAYSSVSVSDVARVLRAAPRLCTFMFTRDLRGDTSFLASLARPLHPSFVGLVHLRLRCLTINTCVPPPPPDDGCALRLRGTCFPRLRMMRVDGETHFVTPDAT
jgi:hypothetical protein